METKPVFQGEKEIDMLANHHLIKNTPESQAMLSAFKWAAWIIALIAVVLFCSSKPQAERANPEPVSGVITSNSQEAVSLAAKKAAYHQNKPGGSIFPVHGSTPIVAQVAP
jgi:hypothetical protein